MLKQQYNMNKKIYLKKENLKSDYKLTLLKIKKTKKYRLVIQKLPSFRIVEVLGSYGKNNNKYQFSINIFRLLFWLSLHIQINYNVLNLLICANIINLIKYND